MHLPHYKNIFKRKLMTENDYVFYQFNGYKLIIAFQSFLFCLTERYSCKYLVRKAIEIHVVTALCTVHLTKLIF